MLAALTAAIALPLVVHLLFRQRERIIEWAAMRFLPVAKKKRNRRIDHWSLFLARVLGLLLPLLAMLSVLPRAERFWQSIRPGAFEATASSPRIHTVIVLDATLSLTAQRDGETFLEQAKRKAGEVVASANPGDGFSLILLDGASSVRVPGPSNHFDAVRDEISRVMPFHGPTDLSIGLSAAIDVLARSPAAYPHRRVLVFTDRQRTAFAGLLADGVQPAAEIWNRLTTRADVAFVDVGVDGLENLAVTDLVLADPLPMAGDSALVTATVRNSSRMEKRQVRVELAMMRPGAKFTPIETRVIEAIPVNGQASVSFILENRAKFRVPGPHVIRVKLTEADALSVDDERSLAFDVRDGLNVLLVNGQPAGPPLKRASEFLAEALAPGGRYSPGNPFRPRTISYEEFHDATLSDLANIDCLVLCDVPGVTPSQVARIESHLKRGGGVIIGLGPNAVAHREIYNRLLSDYLPGTIVGERHATVNLVATDAAYRLPPLNAFPDANARAALSSVPFHGYVRLDPHIVSGARRILAFAGVDSANDEKPDAALVEMIRHRGRVVVFTSTLNRDWTDWPVLPSFLPFAHELVRFASSNRDPWTISVGEAIEDYFPADAVGRPAFLTKPDGSRDAATISAADSGGVVRFNPQPLAGLCEITVANQMPHPLAVNVPNSTAGINESDLRRLDTREIATINPAIQIVSDTHEMKSSVADDGRTVLTPKPQGPFVAKWLAIAGLAALVLELLLAWRFGPARTVLCADPSSGTLPAFDRLLRLVGWLMAFVMIVLFVVVVPSTMRGDLPEFVPYSVRDAFEKSFEVPKAGPGEGTRWRFASSSVFVGSFHSDRFWITGVIVALILGALILYHKERRAVGSSKRLVLPFLMRASVYLTMGLVILPQLRLVFEREGLPEIAIILDTSASMESVDRDQSAPRLQRVIDHLLKDDAVLLARLQRDRRVIVHVYALDDQTRLIASLEASADLESARTAIAGLKSDGPASRLGDGVDAVLKAHRGGSLAAIILASDGITTQGADLSTAGRNAARAGVPLYTIGVGDHREPLDLAIADVKADDVVAKGDEWISDARILTRGAPTTPIKVTLFEKKGEARIALQTITVAADPGGKPIPIRLKTRPAESGEKTYVIETPDQTGELDSANNRIERTVLVTEGKKLRVLLIEGRSRYEFRFLKTLFEREVEAAGERSIDFKFLLMDAGKDFATTDRSALRAFPSRLELFEYDVVIFGDVDPTTLPRGSAPLQDLADFVRVRGGGLLIVAGEQHMPAKYFDSSLADLLPILPAGESVPPTSEDRPLVDGFQLQLTPLGRQHPLLRLSSEDGENQALWQRLPALFWHSSGYTHRLSAEVMAVHPARGGDQKPGENHALILQQFAGAGRVMFFGFDETWRWRLRKDEELFNRFWRQAVRVLARNRVARVEIRANKPGPFRRDEPISITVRFPDDAPPPTGAVSVSLERVVADGDRENSTMILTKVEGSRATWKGTLSRTPEGVYRFRLLEPSDVGRTPTLEIAVKPPPGESDRLELNTLELSRAASESGGKYYSIDAIKGILDDLPEGLRFPLNQPCPPVPLWNLPLTFVTLLSLLGFEWVLRKRSRLL